MSVPVEIVTLLKLVIFVPFTDVVVPLKFTKSPLAVNTPLLVKSKPTLNCLSVELSVSVPDKIEMLLKVVVVDPAMEVVPENVTVLEPVPALNVPLLVKVPVKASVLLDGAFKVDGPGASNIEAEFILTGNVTQSNTPLLTVRVPVPVSDVVSVAVPVKLLVTFCN